MGGSLAAEQNEAQRRVAARLLALGLKPGDRVALLAANSAAFLDVTGGALRLGALPVPLNVHLAPAAITELLDDAEPALVIADAAHAGLVPPGRRLEVLDEGWPPSAPGGGGLGRWPQARAMHYTSGTTGRGKGVYSGLLGRAGGRALCEDERAVWRFQADDVHLVCAPLYHSGPHRFALHSLLYGGRVVVLEQFEPGAVLDAIERERITTSFMVPTHVARLLEHPRFATTDLSSLRWIAHAGAPCPEALKRRALAALPAGSVWEFYGSTEGQFTIVGPDEWLARPGTVGRARSGRRLSVRDERGQPLPPGARGMVYSTAPPFARFTYWHSGEATARAWLPDAETGERFGSFTVGDIGVLDEEGYLTLVGRRTDLILSGGVNVYPAEVERVLLAHPAVGEGAVFGVADEEWGERVCAAVVTRAGAHLDPLELRGWLRSRLAGFQTPKDVVVVDALPATVSGKILRRELPRLTGLGDQKP